MEDWRIGGLEDWRRIGGGLEEGWGKIGERGGVSTNIVVHMLHDLHPQANDDEES